MALRLLRLLTALACVIACGLAAGCTRAPEKSEGRTVIEFWHAMGSGQGRAVNELADRFNKSQEKYYVRTVYQGRYDALNQKLIASLYAGRNPALSQMYPGWTSRFHSFGYLEPVENFLKNDPEFAAQIPDFYPVMIEEATIEDPATGEKTLVTLPFNKSVYVVQANWTMMEKLGWSEPPRTREEFIRLAEAMTVMPEGATRPTVHGFAVRGMIEDFTVQVMAANGELLDEKTGEILVDSPKTIESLKFLVRLVKSDDKKPIGYVESNYLSSVLGSELVGMYIASTASYPFNDDAVGNKFIWRAFAVPAADPSTTPRTLMQGTNVGIYKNLTPDEKEAAWAFSKYLVEPETNALWAKLTNYMPVRRATLEVPEFAALMEANISYANAVATLDTAAYEPRMMYWESVRQTLNRTVQAVLLGREEPEAAMAAARKEIELIQRAAK